MNNKTAIITGASTGIGKAITEYFLNKGMNVIMNSANEANLAAAYAALGSPVNAHCVAGDIAEKSTSEELIKTALDLYGRVDVLINNAGIFSPKPFLEVSGSDLDRYLDVNLKGSFFTSQAVIRQMIEQSEGGAIINIGTVLVDHAIAGFPATAPIASKGAIHSLTRQLAAEFGRNNIRVNTIAPGIIRSPLQAKIGVEDADSLAGLHLLDRIGEPLEVAEAAYYLATSKFVTGETLNVAGGHTVGHAL
jgi:NAD(P)-dependent dehydrogenase (short-subunit alcohol dehydrogenase family)